MMRSWASWANDCAGARSAPAAAASLANKVALVRARFRDKYFSRREDSGAGALFFTPCSKRVAALINLSVVSISNVITPALRGSRFRLGKPLREQFAPVLRPCEGRWLVQLHETQLDCARVTRATRPIG